MVLPQAKTLCVIRYLEESRGSAIPNGRDGEETKLNGQEEGLLETPRLQTTGELRTFNNLQAPDDRHTHTRAEYTDFRSPPDNQRLGRPIPIIRPIKAHPSRIYKRPTSTGRPDPREPPDDR